VKGGAVALSVRAQRCQSHYFSTTPSTTDNKKQKLLNQKVIKTELE